MINLPRLVLFPWDANSQPVSSSVIHDHLFALEMTSGIAQQDKNLLLPGPAFMSLITFLGCSPIGSNTTAGEIQATNQYLIEVVDSSDSVVAICGEPRQAPRCPQCNQTVSNWNDASDAGVAEYVCTSCGYRSQSSGWDWRHQAGFGRQWINIWGVHEGEAVPGEKLLNSLQEISGSTWNYAWCRNQSR